MTDPRTSPDATLAVPVPASPNTSPATPADARQPVAWLPIGAAIVVVAGFLAATASRYGYHRDELYFLMLKPAWGYVDQPPLTPLMARAASALFGDNPAAMRIPAVICVAVAILLSALTARELGGGRAAQALAAWGFGLAGLTLVSGHLMNTGTVDLALWAAVLLCVTRALLRANPRWWLVAGVLVGLSLYNKLLIGMLLISLAVALPIVGPRRVLRSPWLWGGVGLAVLIGLPNLIYQATHDFPQLTMAQALSENNGGDVRVQLLPFQVILVGLTVFPICVVGFVALWRRPQWRPIRSVALAYLVALVLAFVGGGQIYYTFGLLAFLLAAGCVPTEAWLRSRARRGVIVAAVAINGLVSVAIALPLLSANVMGSTPIPDLNETLPDQVGWPVYVHTVADVYQALPADDQAKTVLFTSNYGEAGALTHFGPAYGLPRAYSGQNELYYQGPPDAAKTVVIVWTEEPRGANQFFASCDPKATMDNGVGVDNEEQGSVVLVCRDPIGGWSTIWPRLQHYD